MKTIYLLLAIIFIISIVISTYKLGIKDGVSKNEIKSAQKKSQNSSYHTFTTGISKNQKFCRLYAGLF